MRKSFLSPLNDMSKDFRALLWMIPQKRFAPHPTDFEASLKEAVLRLESQPWKYKSFATLSNTVYKSVTTKSRPDWGRIEGVIASRFNHLAGRIEAGKQVKFLHISKQKTYK